MKILYSVQATGNGHISRAMELLPHFQKYGSVDIFLSGENSSLHLDGPVKYRSKGLSLYYKCTGKLDHWKLAGKFSPFRMMKEIRDLPVEKYDLVINDFECITALACKLKKKPSVNFGHQASFQSLKTPRPDVQSKFGEWILKNYARASQYIGLHFECYDNFIFPAVIKEEILRAEKANKGHITVYLPSYCDHVLENYLKPLKDFRFEVFSHTAKEKKRSGNIEFIPVNKNEFNKSLLSCHGIITGGGFETPAEALYLRKKLLSIPINGQYEQQCNAAALKKLGVPVLNKLDDDFTDHFNGWMNTRDTPKLSYDYSTESIVKILMYRCSNLRHELDLTYPGLMFN